MTARELTAALAYSRHLGWPVFPLRGKVPAIPNDEPGGRGHLDATADPEMIRAFWTRYPRANVGVSCIGSGFVALDVDPRHGGDQTLAEIESRYGPLPHTVRQISGGDVSTFCSARSATFISRDRSAPVSTSDIGAALRLRRASTRMLAASTHGRPGIIQSTRRLQRRPLG